MFTARNARRTPVYVQQLVAAAAAHPQFDVDLVPVAIFWGRAPHKEASLWRLLFAENWVLVGRFRKVLSVLVNGRNTLVDFGEPVRLRDALQDGMEPAAQRALDIAKSARRPARAARFGDRARSVAPPHLGGAIAEDRGRARRRAPRNAGARIIAPRRAARGA